ncbi:HU family DNA-binding protein [Acidithiobacillus ferriphilus]|uniref:HU family DNA-binding protein n=1 Tax=Acidithiobacillus ferriphilus TaxID=1689834 RepID=UPI001C06B3BB|nr:HU family DNA-binding protein [Acidithiobacillus ferriphilus]MBU2831847.1 HU family DNA-binding protein [Acidithiobacillus ferriphilus]
MNKSEFVAAMSRHGAMSKADAEKVLEVFRHTLEMELPETDRIALPGIGVFAVVEKAARKGRNPATGLEIDIPAKKAIKFKPAKELADKINH